MKAKILIVDDEKSIVETMQYNLEKEGWRTRVASDGAAALEMARRELPDAVLLDWMLPEMDGLEVCRALRQDPKTARLPIIMLTVKSDETDKVLGLEMGADDYLTKPFSSKELVARIKAVLRRSGEPPAAGEELFVWNDLKIDWARYLVWVKQRAVGCTPKEFELLKALIQANGRVLSREQLLEKVWGYDRAVEIETRTVDLHISQLRRKLGPLGVRIRTVKGVGYRFALDDE